ncbi:transcriptional regulator [Vibrio ostreicida]|uniref:Transcriptional regulator n=1 Tax=Vibrio ostreicida TaxID=526588 RepID=A0ABT8BY44_9VIBR|nr:transcriptional regulator [Vibrio ostreicida]MDN3612075.1 transcriptional regulator [Vibrio ostreicida]NPD08754.1 transcriptional regulator [Vibrio ostreicida]
MHIGADFLLAALRLKIKSEGLCYSQISERAGVPLSTVKRHLHNPALGLDKVLMYAHQLNSDLIELTQIAIQIQRDNEQFLSDEQNALFAEHPYLLDFIYLITSRNQTPDDIAEHYQLNEHSLRFYLSIGEILGYWEMHGNKVMYHSGKRFIMEDGSALDKLFKSRFEKISMADPRLSQVCQARVRLTKEQQQKLEQEIDHAVSEMHAVNCANQMGEQTNVLLRMTSGQQIYFSDGLPQINGELLKQIAAKFKPT